MKYITTLLLAFSLHLLAIRVRAQTQVTAPMTGTPAAGSYFSYSSIKLDTGFKFTATTGSSLSLYIVNPDCQNLINSFNQNQNYIVTSVPRVGGIKNAGTTPNSGDLANRNACELMQTIQYFDGLGRPSQTVQVQGSPLNKDLVQPFVYDPYGREAQKYLPYAATTANGSYKTDALTTGITGFYNPTGNGTSGSQQANGIPVITVPYAQTVFESSPLNRAVEQGAPGTDWQPAAGHTRKIVYTTNNEIAVTDTANTMLAMIYTAKVNANQSRTLVQGNNQGAYYKAGQLYVTISKDENWVSRRGGTIEEYKDKEGHVVLKRTFNYTGSALQILSTYYVYDELGNLAFVLPPGTNPDAMGVPAYAGSMGYSYRYDERNRLTQKKIPGKGWIFIVYNKLDQPVLSQDSLQRQNNQWMVNKYDAIGRVIATGLWNAGSPRALKTLQDSIYAGKQWDKRDSTKNATNYPTGYMLSSYPALSKTLMINYYDDYNNIPKLPNNYKVTNGVSTMTRGVLTVTKTAVLNTITNTLPDMLWSVSYYDDKGRVIQGYKQHYLGSSADTTNFDVVQSYYNFNDQLTRTNRKHFTKATIGTPLLTINNQFSYDHMGRRLITREQLQNGSMTADGNPILSKLVYNEIGQVWKKNLHSTDSTTFKQIITYGYNERGWLKSSSAPLFAETLYYNDAVNASKQYNGNIASQYWGTAASLTNNYAYGYDKLNRLISGNSNTTGNNENGISYDLMGNITGLKRYTANTLSDQLVYTYTAGTNTLTSVNDAIAGTIGQKGGATNYTYDGNGNLTSDDGKGITGISYNLLNLPQTITGKSTTYTYDAAGQKLSRLIGTVKTDYIAGIQYDGTATNSTISFVQTEEGRALPNGTTAYNYEYTLTDHLGNSRVNFDTGTGTARQVQADDYYPFGMDIVIGSRPSPKNNYLYNKKELQEDLGLYDYGARFYNPVIGRWTSVDPLTEKNRRWSPYVYCKSSPIIRVDPDGMIDIVRLDDGTTFDDKSVNSQAEVSKKYGAGALDVSGQTWKTGRDGVSVHFYKDSWDYVNKIKDIPYSGTTMALQDGIRANLPMLKAASAVATITANVSAGGFGSMSSSGFSILAEGGLKEAGIRASTSILGQFATKDGFKGIDAMDVIFDSMLGSGAAAVADGAFDFKPFDDKPKFYGVGFNKSFGKAGFEAAGYYINGKIADKAFNGLRMEPEIYDSGIHAIQIMSTSLGNNLIGVSEPDK